MAQPLYSLHNNPEHLTVDRILDHDALLALTLPNFVKAPHCCQEWVRQVCQAATGDLFDDFWGESALITAQNFESDDTLTVPLVQGSQPGDLLYKMHGSGGDGHVGIRILGNRVAENSSVHWTGRDARGIRPLVAFGNFDLIVRLALLPRFRK